MDVLVEVDFAADFSSQCFFLVTRECPISEDYELVDINQGEYVSFHNVFVICEHFENVISLKKVICVNLTNSCSNSTFNLT